MKQPNTTANIIVGSPAHGIPNIPTSALGIGLVLIVVGGCLLGSRLGAKYLRNQQAEVDALERQRQANNATIKAGIVVGR